MNICERPDPVPTSATPGQPIRDRVDEEAQLRRVHSRGQMIRALTLPNSWVRLLMHSATSSTPSIGGPEVMRKQLKHLENLATGSPNVQV